MKPTPLRGCVAGKLKAASHYRAARGCCVIVLMRDLSPFCVLLCDPTNHSRRQDRSAAVTRRNVEFILNGHPDAVPLFK
jgi:hypothetical protein